MEQNQRNLMNFFLPGSQMFTSPYRSGSPQYWADTSKNLGTGASSAAPIVSLLNPAVGAILGVVGGAQGQISGGALDRMNSMSDTYVQQESKPMLGRGGVLDMNLMIKDPYSFSFGTVPNFSSNPNKDWRYRMLQEGSPHVFPQNDKFDATNLGPDAPPFLKFPKMNAALANNNKFDATNLGPDAPPFLKFPKMNAALANNNKFDATNLGPDAPFFLKVHPNKFDTPTPFTEYTLNPTLYEQYQKGFMNLPNMIGKGSQGNGSQGEGSSFKDAWSGKFMTPKEMMASGNRASMVAGIAQAGIGIASLINEMNAKRPNQAIAPAMSDMAYDSNQSAALNSYGTSAEMSRNAQAQYAKEMGVDPGMISSALFSLTNAHSLAALAETTKTRQSIDATFAQINAGLRSTSAQLSANTSQFNNQMQFAANELSGKNISSAFAAIGGAYPSYVNSRIGNQLAIQNLNS
jgi:hypothetical protein